MTSIVKVCGLLSMRPLAPQCQAQRSSAYLSDLEGRPLPQCQRLSSYVIDGVPLCKLHAGAAALAILLHSGGRAVATDGDGDPIGSAGPSEATTHTGRNERGNAPVNAQRAR